MKTRRLSEIDLARLLAIDGDTALERALQGYDAGGGSWSYEPVRSSTSDILSARSPLYGDMKPLTWARLERQISQACKYGSDQITSNVEVGKILFDASRARGWSAASLSMGRLPIGLNETVRYWSDVLLEDENGTFVPFFDHRRSGGIAGAAERQIVYSMQNIWVRDRYPDLSASRLAVVRFPCVGKSRVTTVDFHNESELLSYDELNERVRRVYEIWARICAAKPGKGSERRGTGTDGFDFS